MPCPKLSTDQHKNMQFIVGDGKTFGVDLKAAQKKGWAWGGVVGCTYRCLAATR